MSVGGLRDCVLAAADALDAARDELGRLDAVAGDGDHGVTMSLAARAVRKALADQPDVRGPDLLTKVALAAGSVGGAIGPLYATGLIRSAAAWRALEPTSGEPTVSALLAGAAAALDAIVALGHAKPGDKTIVDAMAPMVAALADREAADAEVSDALLAAVAGAQEGAASTTDMIASLGRASRLGERGRGSPDPGATSFAIIVDAVVRRHLGSRVARALDD
jgi:dihydroxyacetone kinase